MGPDLSNCPAAGGNSMGAPGTNLFSIGLIISEPTPGHPTTPMDLSESWGWERQPQQEDASNCPGVRMGVRGPQPCRRPLPALVGTGPEQRALRVRLTGGSLGL